MATEDTVKSLPWISVEERLPMEWQEVLLWVTIDDVDPYWVNGKLRPTACHPEGMWVTLGGSYIDEPESVTHWLEVTPPPITLEEGRNAV